MKRAGCDRSWQVEPVRDGRLSAADVASFQRHVKACDVCAAELLALAALERAARSLPIVTSTPLGRRRLRHELLRRANELSVRAPGPASRRAPLLALAALLLVGVLVPLYPTRGGPASVPAAARVPTYRVTASRDATWRVLEQTSTLRLSVKRGRLELSVDKLAGGQRFLVDLPDGEIEVQGTRFAVDVDRARTRSVTVLEGRVALRLLEHAPLTLVAGQGWPAPAPAPELEASAAVAPPSAPPAASAVAPRRRSTSAGAPASELDGGSSETEPVASAFGDAMAAFTAGDYARAEQLFVAFERQRPGDARVEDATFLRAVARSRRGDVKGAESLAREYLRRFPNGLRRVEASQLAGKSGS